MFDADSLVESSLFQPHDISALSPVSLSALKAAAINRWLSEPSQRVCQYEVPGGGVCRDPNCEDIHPSRAGAVEPSGTPVSHRLSMLTSLSSSPSSAVYLIIADRDVALELFAALPKGSVVTLERLETALQDSQRPSIGFEVRVKQALASLGLQMAS